MTLTEFSIVRRAQTSLPMIVAASALALVTTLPLLSQFYIRAVADTLLAALIFHSLIAARLPLLHAIAITALSFTQAGLFLSAAGSAGSIWLAIAVYCVARAAAGFVQHRDARRVMLLGAALSLAQVLDPMGAILAMFLLPVCVGLPRRGEGRDKMGLFALLLFMPVVTAIVLAYTRNVLGLDPMDFARANLQIQPIAHAPLYLLLLAGFASAPVLWLTMFVADLRRAASLITIYAALAALAAIAFAYLLGIERDIGSVMTVSAVASAAALCAWPRIARHADLALAATALAAITSWLLFNLPSVVN
jgi:hypothetical protein